LFKNKNMDSPLCIADLGFSKFINEGERLTSPCGTLGYAAPEVAELSSYTKEVDIWSLGVIMYTILWFVFLFLF
jgi:serine/threonine protein kinase